MALTWNINALSVPASSTNANVLVGSTIEFIGTASTITIYGNANAIGCTHTLFAGQGPNAPLLIPSGSGLNAASTPGAIKTNENFIGQWAVPAGSRLVHAVTNTTGAAVPVNFQYLVQ